MPETNRKKYKYYSKLAFELSIGAVFWSAVVAMVYANSLYRTLYDNEPNVNK
jgi:hypothetical protein